MERTRRNQGGEVIQMLKAPAADVLSGGGEMGALMRSIDWAQTGLGPVESWPQSLRTAVSIMLASRFGMVVAWGPEFIFLYNDRYRPILGATKHPGAMGKRTRDVFPEVWDFIGPLFEKTRTGEAVALDDVLLPLDRNGYLENCHFTLSYSPIRDESGGIGGMLAVVAETTERVEGERRLRTLRELAARASDAKSDDEACQNAARVLGTNREDVPFSLLYLVDDSGERARLLCSTGVAHDQIAPPMIDLDGDDHRGWPIGRVVHLGRSVLVDDLTARFGQHLDGASPYEERVNSAVIMPMMRPGNPHPYGFFIAGVSPRRAHDDRYQGFYDLATEHIVTAITNARAYQEERRRADALAEVDRAKTAFFSNVSHEFRTPLTLMLGPTEDALASTERALRGAELETVHRNAMRLSKLVNSLLDFARIEAGRIDASYEPTDLAQLTSDLASVFRSAIERAGLRFVVETPALPEPIYVDREMWEKIILNLLSNALKFTFEGEIAVSLALQDHHVAVSVRDTGIGIPKAELPHVFDRFHRVKDARSRTHEGTGIGLALVHELVKLHSGRVDVESVVGRGTVFTLTVPRGIAHLPKERIAAERRLVSTAVGASPFVTEALGWTERDISAVTDLPTAMLPTGATPTAGPRARVLLADDNADMREYVKRILSERWDVEAVADGAAALAAARANPPDVIVSDVMMPGLNGFQLLGELRVEARTARVPVILLSARAGEEASIEGMQAGADDYLIKPFSARELVARVSARIEIARTRAAGESERESLLMQAPVPAALLIGPSHVYQLANPHYLRMVNRFDIVGKSYADAFPELRGDPIGAILDRVYQTGEPFVTPEYGVKLDRTGRGVPEDAYFMFNLEPLRDADGQTYGMMAIAVEITEQVRARRVLEKAHAEREANEQRLREEARFTETLYRISKVLSASLDLDSLVQTLTNEATALCHAQFGAFFYNVINDKGESYMLYTLSGVPREAFARFPMPRNTAVFAATFSGQGPVRLDDVRKDPRYGKSAPHYGMPKGHLPVRSYLAVPVVSRSGEVLGGLFFGHEQVGVFTQRDEDVLVAVAAQAATAIDNARLYDAERRARSLAEAAQARTAKLNAMTNALSRALTAGEAARVVITETISAIGADAGGVLLLSPDGNAIGDFIVAGGSHPGLTEVMKKQPLAPNTPTAEAALTGKVAWAASEKEIAERYPQVPLGEQLGAKAWGAVPLVFEGRTIGSLGLRFNRERQLSTEDEEFLLAVGRQCGQALERARLYEAARLARSDAEAASQAKDEFLAMLGHELRNPLSPIVTALQLMKLRGDVKSGKEQDVIERQVHHLVRLVDDLLDISRITRGKVQLDLVPTDLAAVVAKAVEIASPLFEQRRHHFTVAVPREGMRLAADEVRLAQVIANLLTNAAKYTETGGNIALRAWRDGHEIVLQVKDNGSGIAPELLPRVFDLFVQGYQAADRSAGGLGIGLALVRNLVSMHGGTVAALSDGPGGGSEFIVRLPGLPAETVDEQTTTPDSAVEAKAAFSCAHPQRILIVDDNIDAAELLADILAAVGHEVRVAYDGVQALAMLETFAPEVAVLDIGLPVMDGYELAKRLRERLASTPPRMFAVTGYGQEHDIRRSAAAGFERHFVKPLNADSLIAAID